MLARTGFYSFVQSVKSEGRDELRIAISYKPPGSIQRGAINELIPELCRGPLIPDAIVFVSINEDSSVDLMEQLTSDISQLVRQRIAGRIPLVHLGYSLREKSVSVELLDDSLQQEWAALRVQLDSTQEGWITAALRQIFNPDTVLLQAPSGYFYQKPSGSKSKFFLKPDLALNSSSSVAVVAFALFWKLYAGDLPRLNDLQIIFVDTMSIAPIAYSLRDLIALVHKSAAFHLESFHSYGGISAIAPPLSQTSLCLISASSSMAMHRQWIREKLVASNEVATILTSSRLLSAIQVGALAAIDVPASSSIKDDAQFGIRIEGEAFLPAQESAKKVLLNEKDHGCAAEVLRLHELRGRSIFQIYRTPRLAGARIRALCVDADLLIAAVEFKQWLKESLKQAVRASTHAVIYQDDPSSKRLAELISSQCFNELRLGPLPCISATNVDSDSLQRDEGIVICAAVSGKGSALLGLSRDLRDIHSGPRLFVIGFQVTDSKSEMVGLDANLKHSKNGPHELMRFGSAAIGSCLGTNFESEGRTYFGADWDTSALPEALGQRATSHGTNGDADEFTLLPCGNNLESHARLRPGFAYWPLTAAIHGHCQQEVIATMAVILQRSRENSSIVENQRLASPLFRQVLLDPENFARFNDGVIQAALLRCAFPSELDYRCDDRASDFMKKLIVRSLSNSSGAQAEALLEFISAIYRRRLQLTDGDEADVLDAVSRKIPQGSQLCEAVSFLTGRTGRSARLPF